MSVQKDATGQEQAPADVSTESAAGESQTPHLGPSSSTNDHTGSLGSHLMFGLGTLVFVTPMLVPGISMVWLSIIYGSLIVALVAGIALWSMVGSFRRRRSGS